MRTGVDPLRIFGGSKTVHLYNYANVQRLTLYINWTLRYHLRQEGHVIATVVTVYMLDYANSFPAIFTETCKITLYIMHERTLKIFGVILILKMAERQPFWIFDI